MESSAHTHDDFAMPLNSLDAQTTLAELRYHSRPDKDHVKSPTTKQELQTTEDCPKGLYEKMLAIDFGLTAKVHPSTERSTIAKEGPLGLDITRVSNHKINDLTRLGYAFAQSVIFLAKPTYETAKAVLATRLSRHTADRTRNGHYKSLKLYDAGDVCENWVLFDPGTTLTKPILLSDLLPIVKLAFWEIPMTRYLEYNTSTKAIRCKSGALTRFRDKQIIYTPNGPRLADIDDSSDSELTDMESD